MSYLVFARKYRPQTFDEVLGQEHVGKTLLNAISGGRLAHAYLFSGPRGVGKTTMARLLAKAVNCPVSPGASPCGTCDICSSIAAGSDVDVLEIDAASNRKVEDVEPLVDASRYLPSRSERKVFIVDEAHMLSKHAWNALLKTLEEPPPHVLFIFATTEPQKVIETVRSRCQRFDFRRITPADITRKLRLIADAEKMSVDDAVLEEIASRSTGGLRDAETMLDQLMSAAPTDRALTVPDLVAILGDTPRDVRIDLLERAAAGAMTETLDAAAAILEAGADAGELLRTLFHDLHDTVVARARGQAAGDGSALSIDWCLAASEVLGRHLALADRSRAPRATLDLALLAMARLGDVRDLEELVGRLEGLAAGQPQDVAPRRGPAQSAPSPEVRTRAQSAAVSNPGPARGSISGSTSGPTSGSGPEQPSPRAPQKPRIDLRARLNEERRQREAREPSGDESEGPTGRSRRPEVESKPIRAQNEERRRPPSAQAPSSPSQSKPSQSKPSQSALAESGPASENTSGRSINHARPAAGSVSSEEMARLRALPRVQEVLGAFQGRIEHVRQDG